MATMLCGSDFVLIGYLAEWGHVLARDLAIGVGRPERKVAERLWRLRAQGWVASDRLTPGPSAWRATAAGLALICSPCERPAPRLSAQAWLFELTASAVGAALLAEGGRARRVRRRTDGRLSFEGDIQILADEGEPTLVVEIELGRLGETRRRLLAAHRHEPERVVYLARPRVRAQLARTVHHAGQLRVLSTPIVRRPGGYLEPDSAAARALARQILASCPQSACGPERIATTRAGAPR